MAQAPTRTPPCADSAVPGIYGRTSGDAKNSQANTPTASPSSVVPHVEDVNQMDPKARADLC